MTSRAHAEETADDRLRRIESVTDVTLAHLDVESLLVELLDRVRELLQVDTAVVLLLDERADDLVATVARGLEEEVRYGVRVPMGKGFAGRVAAEAQPLAVPDIVAYGPYNPLLVQKGLHSVLGVPLLVEGQVIGVLHVGSMVTRDFTGDDIELLQLVADRVALATQARRRSVEHAATLTLQRSLLPPRLPAVSGLDLAARYLPGEEGGVGGDWYDVFTVGAGRVCIVMGDVVGRGLRAAVVMGRLRSTVRAYALESDAPAEVLAKVDAKLQHFEPGEMATVLFAVLDASYDRLLVSSAGHLAPVLAPPGGPAVVVDVWADPPLGVKPGIRRRTAEVEVPAGSMLCFYTDGLVERRGEPVDLGIERLRKAMHVGPSDSVCAAVVAELIGTAIPIDDIALLVARRRDDAQAPLELSLPAVPASLSEVRAGVRRWLAGSGAGTDVIDDVLIAVGEACSNVVEHAYGPLGGSLEVRLELEESTVVATVLDAGRWRAPRGRGRGRGTLLMESCSDDVRVVESAQGTTVIIRRRLGQREGR